MSDPNELAYDDDWVARATELAADLRPGEQITLVKNRDDTVTITVTTSALYES